MLVLVVKVMRPKVKLLRPAEHGCTGYVEAAERANLLSRAKVIYCNKKM